MSFQLWNKKWLVAVTLCLITSIICSLLLLLYVITSTGASDPKYVVNQVRLAGNPIILYLERNGSHLDRADVREALLALTESSQIKAMYAELDGTVTFNSAGALPQRKLNLQTELHYDLHDAATMGNEFRIAFPIVDELSQTLTGNVILTLPSNKVIQPTSYKLPIALFLMASALSLLCAMLALTIRRKLKREMITPIHTLKQHAEAILKGNYETRIQYDRMDELGELYTMFDLMRTEIMHLSMERITREKAQKELVTNISHELKTPLTTMKAYIDAILEGVCSDEEMMMEYVEVMRGNTDKMARLVEDLLIHALQELGQISVEPQEQYSQEVLEPMLKTIGHYVRTNGLLYTPPREIPNVLVRIDSVRIEQVISNLVSNALKHTTPGDSIRINTQLEPGQLRITIADSGKGIRAQDMPFIFERYFKGRASDPGTEGVQKGTGLGLSICKTIIEAHGGQISFTSKEKEGTVFHFTLPV
ncbi:sensor histidine kinase [Paenibacillus daejeonensis]|uniref:sensor histidine kinase n=1 Tax=Paenibacillus daejeonensis TaxID=135193 RepID=UPI00036B3A59|nr:HAMP domain-containing sensor histidine kinase [Paenibacillus daejeonensis]